MVTHPLVSDLTTSVTTINDAIALAQSTSRSMLSQIDREVIAGRVIQNVSWSDDVAHLALSGGLQLEIVAQRGGVEWAVVHSRQEDQLRLRNNDDDDNDEIVIQMAKSRFVWKRAARLLERVNGTITNLFAGPSWLYLYVEGAPTLLFAVLLNGGERPILYWDNTQ